MAESVSYWICPCGKSNLNSTKRCAACGKKRTLSWRAYALIAFVGLVGIAFILPSSEPQDGEQDNVPQFQADFLQAVESARREVAGSANSLAASEALLSRDADLSRYDDVTNWRGNVTGVHRMQGKGAIGIDIGGVELVAGQHLLLGLETLVPPSQQDLYAQLLALEAGEAVVVSGSFVTHEGALVELSYTGSGSAGSPRFLFDFEGVSPLPR